MSPRLARLLHIQPKPPTPAEQARARVRELTLAITECRAPVAASDTPMTSRDLERELDPNLPKETPPRGSR